MSPLEDLGIRGHEERFGSLEGISAFFLVRFQPRSDYEKLLFKLLNLILDILWTDRILLHFVNLFF